MSLQFQSPTLSTSTSHDWKSYLSFSTIKKGPLRNTGKKLKSKSTAGKLDL